MKIREIYRLRVLSVRTGSNPNSSSFGINVMLLLAGGALAGLLTAVGGTLARFVLLRRRPPAPRQDAPRDAG